MLKKEWKSLFQNKLLMVVVIAIIVIPIIYAGLFLKSMWDPYGNLDKLPVAVVNKDQSVEYEGKTLKVGEDMVDELKDNESLAFNFVDDEVAQAGLKNGTYYMVITIPENFSKNASTLMDDTPSKMELKYETNPGTNYIASKMSETALLRIKDAVATNVTKVYTESVFDSIVKVGDGMDEAADGSGKIRDGLQDASTGNKKITKNLKKLADSTLTFEDGADTLAKGLKDYTAGVSQVNDGASKLNSGVSTLTSKIPTLTAGTSKLNSGVKEYTAGVAKLNNNSSKLISGTKQLVSGVSTLNSGAKKYVAGVDTLADGVNAYAEGAGELAAGAKQLEPLEKLGDVSDGINKLNVGVTTGTSTTPSLLNGTQQLEAGLKEMYTQVTQMADSTSAKGLAQMSTKLNEAREGMDKASLGMAASSEGIHAAATAMTATGTAMTDQLAPALAGIPESMNQLGSSVGDVFTKSAQDAVAQVDAANNQITKSKTAMGNAASALSVLQANADADGKISAASLDAVIQSLNSSSGNLSNVSYDPTIYQQGMQQIFSNAQEQMAGSSKTLSDAVESLNVVAKGLTDGAAVLESASKEMSDGADQLAAGVAQIPSNIPNNPLPVMEAALKQLYDGSAQVYGGTKEVSDGLVQLQAGTKDFPKAAAGIKALNDGFDQLTANTSKLTQGAADLKEAGSQITSGISQLATGANTLNSGVKEYTSGVSTLNSNSKALTDGTGELASGAVTLASGARELSSGTSTLYSGTKKLVANNTKLNDGVDKLSDGAVKISDGSSKLYDGSKELGDGITKMEDGSETLTTKLSDGASEVKDVKTGDNTVDMFSTPVDSSETKITEVPNNGHAMAPYMMSVGLWVGCLAFCLMYPLMKYHGKLKSGFSWWLSKASILYLVAILQGISLILLLHVFNDFTPVEMGKTIAFACLASVTFTSIMYFFNSNLGKVGSFLMLVFMVVQLAGSAGTYPVEISPAFVAKIHNYLPFTYTVFGFRSTICGGESITHAVIVMCIITVIFTGLTIFTFQLKARKIKRGGIILFDWLEERGLA